MEFLERPSNSAFTLIEFLIVTFIIITLSIIVLANYEFGGYQFNLKRSAHKLSQDLRRAQEMAMSAKEFEGSVPAGGYGIYLHRTSFPNSYILFADSDGEGDYDSGEEVEDSIEFEEYVEISELCIVEGDCDSDLAIIFIPPDPIVKFDTGVATSTAQITLLSMKTSGTVVVSINRLGLVEIE